MLFRLKYNHLRCFGRAIILKITKWLILRIVAAIATVIVLVLLIQYIGIDLILFLIGNLNLYWIMVFVGVYSFTFILRAIRWKSIVKATDHNIGIPYTLTMLWSGWFVNEVTPAKIGDVVRIYLLYDKEKEMSFGESTSTVAVERIFDILAIVLLASILFGVVALNMSIPDEFRNFILIAFVVGFVLLGVIVAFIFYGERMIGFTKRLSTGLYERLFTFVIGFKEGMSRLYRRPKILAIVALLSIPIWLLEATSIVFITRSTGFFLPIEICLLAAVIGFLSKLIPLLPGGFLIYEFSVGFILSMAGPFSLGAGSYLPYSLSFALFLPLSLGVAFALLDHIVKFVYCSVTGIPSIIYNGVGTKFLSQKKDTVEIDKQTKS